MNQPPNPSDEIAVGPLSWAALAGPPSPRRIQRIRKGHTRASSPDHPLTRRSNRTSRKICRRNGEVTRKQAPDRIIAVIYEGLAYSRKPVT